MTSLAASDLPDQATLSRNIIDVMNSLREERVLVRNCYRFYQAQYPRRAAGISALKIEETEWTAICAAAISDGASLDNVVDQIRVRIRSAAKSLMVLAENEVFDRFNETREKYKAKLDSYAGRHPLTANARSVWDLDLDRDKQIVQASAVDKLPINCPYDQWRETFAAERAALNAINSITSAMSAELLTWKKYIDDKLRLNIALAALLASLFFNGGDKIIHYLWPKEVPAGYLYDCASSPRHMRCVVKPSK